MIVCGNFLVRPHSFQMTPFDIYSCRKANALARAIVRRTGDSLARPSGEIHFH